MSEQINFEAFLTEPRHVDCATAVMLKILDGKCKMPAEEKFLMEALYDETKVKPGLLLGPKHHSLIQVARFERDHGDLPDPRREQVYEQRLYAETMISRPVMKAFKAGLRALDFLPAHKVPGPGPTVFGHFA